MRIFTRRNFLKSGILGTAFGLISINKTVTPAQKGKYQVKTLFAANVEM